MAKLSSWIEAMRLRTLPVSAAGVITGIACGVMLGHFALAPSIICLAFAILAQICSNFANEYFDFRNGIDTRGRAGFRRGVTEGDISPRAMLIALAALIALTCAVGLTLLLWGKWWFILVGIAVIIFAMAYSAGPYPLSHHGLGDIAVVLFYGIVPVTLTTYMQSESWTGWQYSLAASIAVGLMGANVLIVNNYRDADDDSAVGKHTTVVIFGRPAMLNAYLASGFIAIALMAGVWNIIGPISIAPIATYLLLHIATWRKMRLAYGAALNPILGATARNLLIFATLTLLTTII